MDEAPHTITEGIRRTSGARLDPERVAALVRSVPTGDTVDHVVASRDGDACRVLVLTRDGAHLWATIAGRRVDQEVRPASTLASVLVGEDAPTWDAYEQVPPSAELSGGAVVRVRYLDGTELTLPTSAHRQVVSEATRALMDQLVRRG